MVKYILIKSPDEWATTKQACRDELVVYLFLFSHRYICMYMYMYMCIYLLVNISEGMFFERPFMIISFSSRHRAQFRFPLVSVSPVYVCVVSSSVDVKCLLNGKQFR